MKYAVVKTGGKQYLVKPGQRIKVEKLTGDSGTEMSLDNVLLVADGDQLKVGRPIINGAKVTASIIKQGRGKKIIVQKYKPKVRYQRKQGHRQPFTEIVIGNIEY